MSALLLPAAGAFVFVGAVGRLDEKLGVGISELSWLRLRNDGNGVVDGTVVVVENGSGGFVLAEATSAAGSVAAPGPLPTAGTIPICFEAVATESFPTPSPSPSPSPSPADGDDELVAEGKAVDDSTGASVLADATSAAGSVAAPGPLPTAGTIPTCLEVFKGSGGSVFADTISSSSILAAPEPLPAAGTEPICFVVIAGGVDSEERVGASVMTGCTAASSMAD